MYKIDWGRIAGSCVTICVRVNLFGKVSLEADGPKAVLDDLGLSESENPYLGGVVDKGGT